MENVAPPIGEILAVTRGKAHQEASEKLSYLLHSHSVAQQWKAGMGQLTCPPQLLVAWICLAEEPFTLMTPPFANLSNIFISIISLAVGFSQFPSQSGETWWRLQGKFYSNLHFFFPPQSLAQVPSLRWKSKLGRLVQTFYLDVLFFWDNYGNGLNVYVPIP